MKTILLPVDHSDVTPLLISTAKKMAAAFRSRVVLLHVVEYVVPAETLWPDGSLAPAPMPMPIVVPRDLSGQQKMLDALKSQFDGLEGVDVSASVVEGITTPAVINEAEALGADLIIVGSHGHGALYDMLVGSVTAGVLKSARCPVLVVPSTRT